MKVATTIGKERDALQGEVDVDAPRPCSSQYAGCVAWRSVHPLPTRRWQRQATAWTGLPGALAWYSELMVDAVALTQPEPPLVVEDADGWPLDAADFPGCEVVPMSLDEMRAYKGRMEFWDSRTETAMMLRETSSFHEQPSHRLASLLGRVSAASGTLIEMFGTTDLVRNSPDGSVRVLMQADQIIYVQPAPEALPRRSVDVNGGRLPDVILEVDHSTDVRRGKLPRYEAWGLPEVWVDVTDERAPSRALSRLPGLTIHLLEDGRFHTSEESRAFPGWKAAEIHRALNDRPTTAETFEALHRVGRALGRRHGTGPDDDPWLEPYLTATRAEGRTEGRTQGRAEGLLGAVTALLHNRGIPTPHDMTGQLAQYADRPAAELMVAAQACRSADDLLKRLRG